MNGGQCFVIIFVLDGVGVWMCSVRNSESRLQIELWILAKLNAKEWNEVTPTAIGELTSPGYSRDFTETKRLAWRNAAKAVYYCKELQKFDWSAEEKQQLMEAWQEGLLDACVKHMEHLPGQWPYVKKMLRARQVKKQQEDVAKVRAQVQEATAAAATAVAEATAQGDTAEALLQAQATMWFQKQAELFLGKKATWEATLEQLEDMMHKEWKANQEQWESEASNVGTC